MDAKDKKQPTINRFDELKCLVWGHDWFLQGTRKTEFGLVLTEYYTCKRCWLEKAIDCQFN